MVQKTQRKFSALAIDNAHEQNNKLVKGKRSKVTYWYKQNSVDNYQHTGTKEPYWHFNDFGILVLS